MALQKKIMGERVTLRALSEKDSKAFFALVEGSRAHLNEWLPWVESHTSVEHSEAFLSAAEMQFEMENGGFWGIFAGKVLMGCVALHWIQWEHAFTSLGYWLGKPYLRQGFACEACQLLVKHCFDDLKINRIEISVAESNHSSLQLARSLGFLEEGRRRQFERLHGKFQDHIAFALLFDDFRHLGSPSNQNRTGFSPT